MEIESQANPKKILSIDGGGIKGVLSLGILKKIESRIRITTNNPDAVLGDYYDLICGTSAGAIISCALAIGMSVDEILLLYFDFGEKVFNKGRRHKFLKRDWIGLRSLFNENYSSKTLEGYLKNTFNEITIGDRDNVKCGLAINCKRADSYSLWTISNHPNAKYYCANAEIKLWELCRASSAAPYYFKPKKIVLKTNSGNEFPVAFIDGGISLANNPAWLSFLVAVTPTFGFNWGIGSDKICITSVGSGIGLKKENPIEIESLLSISWASRLSDLFMIDAAEMNQILFDFFGNNLGPDYSIDRQFEQIKNDSLLLNIPKLFSYERYSPVLSKSELKALDIELTEESITSLHEMDHYENMKLLYKIGASYADRMIKDV